MTTAAALLSPRTFPPSSEAQGDAAATFSLTEPMCVVAQIGTQARGVIHQIVLDPAKIKDGLIRLGDWPGDEYVGWQVTGNVTVLVVLGRAENVQGTTRVTPIE